MKLVGNTLQRTFLVTHRGKEYFIDYLESNYPNSAIINREKWRVVDKNGEELNIYSLKSNTKKEIAKINLTRKKWDKLIKFCVKNFNSYQPEI